jgi:hypothetical protein
MLRSTWGGLLAVAMVAALAPIAVAVGPGGSAEPPLSGYPATGSAPQPTPANLALGAQTQGRVVVVLEGGGSTHPYTTPWDACDGGRPAFVEAMIAAGLPVFTAAGFSNTAPSTAGRTGCPPQPPLEVQWNTSGYPTQAGQAVLGLLGYLNATYGYTTFDLVGYSYGGVISRAAVAALKQPPAPGALAPGFSYAQAAIEAGVTIPTIVTMNTPHLGAPSYDVAFNPARYEAKVRKAWGAQYARTGVALRVFELRNGAGAIQVLRTKGHARPGPGSWDMRQVGLLDGVALTLIAGDYCGRTCGKARQGQLGRPAGPGRLDPGPGGRPRLRTDATVPVYSQLMLPCPKRCPAPPGSVYIPPGMVPEGTVRKIFPTVHSTYDALRLGLPATLSVSKNPEAIAYLVATVTGHWTADGSPLMHRP